MSSKVRAAERKEKSYHLGWLPSSRSTKAPSSQEAWSIADYSASSSWPCPALVQAGQNLLITYQLPHWEFLCFHLQNNFYLYSTNNLNLRTPPRGWKNQQEMKNQCSRTSLFLAQVSVCRNLWIMFIDSCGEILCLQGENWRRSLPHYNQVNTAKTMIELAIQQLKERNIRFNQKPWRWPHSWSPPSCLLLSQGNPWKMVLRFSPPTE